MSEIKRFQCVECGSKCILTVKLNSIHGIDLSASLAGDVCGDSEWKELEPEYRAFKPGEMTSEWADKRYRMKGETKLYSVALYDPREDHIQIALTNLCGSWTTNETLFEDWEAIEKDGSVSVIGVKL